MQQLSIDDEGADWEFDPRGLIKKVYLTFATNFFWLLVRHHLYPITGDNILS